MDKLTNIQIKNDQLTFTVDTELNLSGYDMEVHIDEVYDLQNILKDSPFHSTSIGNTITIDDNNNVVVTNADEVLALDWNMKYITLHCFSDAEDLYFHGVYYNPEIIYAAEIRKLKANCSTCLDDQTMQNLMLIVFKRQLLEYAIEGGHFKDTMQLYVDLCKLLDISTNCTKCKDCNCRGILTQKGVCLNTECGRCVQTECSNRYKYTKQCTNELSFSIDLNRDTVDNISTYGNSCSCCNK